VADDFRSLASILREQRTAPQAYVDRAPICEPAPQPSDPQEMAIAGEAASFCDEIALARIAVFEAYERAVARLIEVTARDLLARELALAPADIAALAGRALRMFADEEPVALVVAPADAPLVNVEIPVRVDPSLTPGDLVVVVRDGLIDARFALRARRCAMVT
jgi:flagellar biosynthesis/type III secretory pathway protein FliH